MTLTPEERRRAAQIVAEGGDSHLPANAEVRLLLSKAVAALAAAEAELATVKADRDALWNKLGDTQVSESNLRAERDYWREKACGAFSEAEAANTALKDLKKDG